MTVDDLSPGVWPIVRSRGDGFTPTAFDVEVDDMSVIGDWCGRPGVR